MKLPLENVPKKDTSRSRMLPDEVTIEGVIKSLSLNIPLGQLIIEAFYIEDSINHNKIKNRKRQFSESIIGEGKSDQKGYFKIVLKDDPAIYQKICLLQYNCASKLMLKVTDENKKTYYSSDLLSLQKKSLFFNILFDFPDELVDLETWKDFGTRLKTNRIVQMNQIVNHLVYLPVGQSIFFDWNTSKKISVYKALENAFLDPQNIFSSHGKLPTLTQLQDHQTFAAYMSSLQGEVTDELYEALTSLKDKVNTYSSLSEVNWIIHPDLITKGKLNEIFLQYEKLIRDRAFIEILNAPSDLSNYRDYLVNIWVDILLSVFSNILPVITRAQILTQLTNRFHQDFETRDNTQQLANELMIEIVTSILIAPIHGENGFGINPISIKPRTTEKARDYLNFLISLTKLDAKEMGLRYRIDLSRTDSETSTSIQENIYTLQHFFSDSFECELEPFHIDPDISNSKQPIIPDFLVGWGAPFYLEYDEWLHLQDVFCPENYYLIKESVNFPLTIGPFSEGSKAVYDLLNDPIYGLINASKMCAKYFNDDHGWRNLYNIVVVYKLVLEGVASHNAGEYGIAQAKFLEANQVSANIQGSLFNRKGISISTIEDLDKFTKIFYIPGYSPWDGQGFGGWDNWRDSSEEKLLRGIEFIKEFLLPYCRADLAFVMGKYEEAISHMEVILSAWIGRATLSSPGGYLSISHVGFPLPHPYVSGDLPYTLRSKYFENSQGTLRQRILLLDDAILFKNAVANKVEIKFYKIAYCNYILGWADSLYRTDDSSNIARARELYKAVLFLHGKKPPIEPSFAKSFTNLYLSVASKLNPAVTVQVSRAAKAFYQIESKLNYYGYRDDVVPSLRYRTLKDLADRLASSAKSAQQDFLFYMGKYEEGILDNLKYANLLKKSQYQAKITSEQGKIAQNDVILAQLQLDKVNADIQAKKQEIADHDSFLGQVSGFIGGWSDIIGSVKKSLDGIDSDLFKDGTKAFKTAFLSEAGIEEMSGGGILGLGAGATVLMGSGVFMVGNYISMSSMADQANKRMSDLHLLMEKALPAAETQMDSKKREVIIAGYQQQIANADYDLANALITFQSNRFLSIEFWNTLARLMKRIMERYLELSAKMAWFAERAVSYEQDREINIIRLDYFPNNLQGVSGADLLLLDLAELETTRIEGIRETIPVKHTISLLRDFPLQYSQLITTGKCQFITDEILFRSMFPGTYAYRIINVTPTILNLDITNNSKGLLSNEGFSNVSKIDDNGHLTVHSIIRPADGLPISEFKLQKDLKIYELPGEALMPFEGSGVESVWALELPINSNLKGFSTIADALITFDCRAKYSHQVHRNISLTNQSPQSLQKMVFTTLRNVSPDLINDFIDPSKTIINVSFPLIEFNLPLNESNRKIKNVILLIINDVRINIEATLNVGGIIVDFSFVNNLAMSNSFPFNNSSNSSSVTPPAPLNTYTDKDFNNITLIIDKSKNLGTDWTKIENIILGVEYSFIV